MQVELVGTMAAAQHRRWLGAAVAAAPQTCAINEGGVKATMANGE